MKSINKKLHNLNINYLIKIRSHLGHKTNSLNSKISSYIYGTRHNINIYNVDKLWKPYRYLFFSLVENISRRNSFFLIGTNKNLPMENLITKFINRFIEDKPKNDNNKNYKLFYLKGYIIEKWVGGLFSNWKITLNFIKYINNSKKKNKKRYQKYLYYLKGIDNLQKNPTPDFLFVLHSEIDALIESNNLQIPALGLIDTNMDPDYFLYKFFGNNDSVENILFIFEFLDEAIKEGRLKEQQLFFFYILVKIKKKLNK